MAPPPAAGNFGQKQPITTTIKNICQYYPPNTCLRELLQNTDDAGATEIEYVLDTKTYDQEPLLSTGLKDFQGPALLARNNSVFRDEDFNSLSSIGDSIKAQDPASTGKFGQGFNAVYHWTDGPWIYSREWLLVLDPYEWWSRETGNPGGPRWDVYEHRHSIEVQNQLMAFSVFGLSRCESLNQTVVRIPLRTEVQQQRVKFSTTRWTLKRSKRLSKSLVKKWKKGGLLFLKHIRKIIIRTDNNAMLVAETIQTTTADTQMKDRLATDFNGLYATPQPQITKDIFTTHELAIRYTRRATSKVDRYAVQHVMLRSSGDRKMDQWGREQKLFPWVAVPALLKAKNTTMDRDKNDSVCGRIFTTLRLPMPTNLPVHVHGLFSIAPDRGRLSFTRDSGDPPTKWNNFMFTECVALAWVKLLVHRSTVSSREEKFAFWPKANFSPVEMWDKLDDSVIDHAIHSSHQIWNTSNERCVDISHGLFANQNPEATKYGSALAQAHIPAIYLEESFFKKVQERTRLHSKNFYTLESDSVRRHLRSNGLLPLSEDVASLALEFCLLDAMKSQLEGPPRKDLYNDLHGIPFWPTVDGLLSISGNGDLLLPRDDDEMKLFISSRTANTLHIAKFRPSVRKLLLKDIQYLAAAMRFRGVADLIIDWPVMYPLTPPPKQSEDWVRRLPHLDKVLSDIWAWIFGRIHKGQHTQLKTLGNLWLVPLDDRRIRKYVPGPKSPPLLIMEPSDPLFEALTNMVSKASIQALPILDNDLLPLKGVRFMRSSKQMRSETNSTSVGHADTFVDWLVAGKVVLSQAPDTDRKALLDHLETITRDSNLPGGMLATITMQMRRLPLYSKISCLPPFSHRSHTWSNLDASEYMYETPPHLPPLPGIRKVSFFDPQSQAEAIVIKRLKVLETITIKNLLSRHLLSWLEAVPSAVDKDLSSAKERLIDWLMANCRPHTQVWQTDVFSHPIIPLPVLDGKRRYRCLSGMIDPSSDLARLYDAEESRFPCPLFFAKHKHALQSYGILTAPLWFTPLEFVRYFNQRKDGLDIRKVERLLELKVLPELFASETYVAEIRGLSWLPGRSVTGEAVLLAPKECRGAEESRVVDKVWGTTALSVKSINWKRLLGWDQGISIDVLIEQLDHCLLTKDYHTANAVLLHIKPTDCTILCSRACILGRSGESFTPGKIFLPESALNKWPLAPYLDEIDAKFFKEHDKLITALDVAPEPSIEHLQDVQNALVSSSENKLDPSSVRIAISVLEIATYSGLDPVELLVPDTTSRLRKLADIVYGELFSWILDFWRYLDSKLVAIYKPADHSDSCSGETVHTLLDEAGLLSQDIYRVGPNQPWRYITPQQFETQPCIVDPVDEQHQKICEQIPGLLILDRRCAPYPLQANECDLGQDASFKRFLQALAALEAINATSAVKLVGQTLSPESKDILQQLALKYLRSTDQPSNTGGAVIRRLPIWRRFSQSTSPLYEHVPAEDSIFCEHGPMLMPWVRDLSKFVKPEIVKDHREQLSELGVLPWTLEETWHMIKGDLPSDIKTNKSRIQYLEFVRYLAKSGLEVYGKLAPNGACILFETNVLYDHEDIVFRAAFREQEDNRFLHTDMRIPELRHMWLTLGLRARSSGGMRHEHFLESTLAINRRWNPAHTATDFQKDSERVASYLKFDGDHFRSWPQTTWAQIATVPMFRARDSPTDEPSYRRTQMQILFLQKTHRALQDSANLDAKRITWSQSSFLKEPPGPFVYQTLPRRGMPTTTQVFEHLIFLVSIIESVVDGDIAEFLRDVQASYQYLQENLDAMKLVPGVHQARIWLNLDTTQVDLVVKDQLEANLTTAPLLCLNSRVNPLPIRVARKFLVPYEKLLAGLGSRAVVQPTSGAQPQSSGDRELSLVAAMTQMRQLREQNQLVDVVLEAKGQKLPAHKIVLAAVSDYCKAQFAGEWGRILEHQATLRLEGLSFLALSQMVNFAYIGEFEWPELKDDNDKEEIESILGMLLDLLVSTDMWLLPRLHDIVESTLLSHPYSDIYIRVDTVEWVKERAETARASKLVKHCEEFFTSNEDFVVALRDDPPVKA